VAQRMTASSRCSAIKIDLKIKFIVDYKSSMP
jgi:hypothetical protein